MRGPGKVEGGGDEVPREAAANLELQSLTNPAPDYPHFKTPSHSSRSPTTCRGPTALFHYKCGPLLPYSTTSGEA